MQDEPKEEKDFLSRKMKSLQNKAEFDFVYKNGRRYYGRGFNLYAINLSSFSLGDKNLSYKERKIFHSFIASPLLFLGLSVSKKIGNAPIRNKIKRRFRAFCRNYENRLGGFVLIFMAKDAGSLEYAMIEEESRRFLLQERAC